MFDIAAPLITAIDRAGSLLTQGAWKTAVSQTRFGDARTDAAMASTAKQALFGEALMAAAHARLAEIKSVTRSA